MNGPGGRCDAHKSLVTSLHRRAGVEVVVVSGFTPVGRCAVGNWECPIASECIPLSHGNRPVTPSTLPSSP